ASGEALSHPLQHARTVQATHFSPDGRRVVTASLDHTARIWDVATGEPLTPPLRHDDQVLDARYSPDGRRVATASADGGVRIWDAAAGLPVTEPLHQNGAVKMVCFSPDSQWIAAGCAGPENGARLWLVPSAPQPIPSWLPELGEAVAGLSIGPHATTHRLPQQTLTELKARLMANKQTNSFIRMAQWFFADRSMRTISPFASATVIEYVKQRIEENTRASLEEAIRLQPTNAVALARLATAVLRAESAPDPRRALEAAHLARRALRFDPDQTQATEVLVQTEHPKSSEKQPTTGR
ncbi:MAG: hypothetical protein DME26_12310, partial [Verrucomicrobia bacterium]